MNSWNNVDLSGKRPDLIHCSSVRTLTVLQDHLPYRLLLIIINGIGKKGEPFFIILEGFGKAIRNLHDIFLSKLLLVSKYCRFHLIRRNEFLHLCVKILRDHMMFIFMLFLAAFFYDTINEIDNGAVDLMSLVNSIYHYIIRYLVGTCLDHDDLFPGGCNSKLQISLVPVSLRGIDNKLAVYHSNLRHRDGTVKGDVGNGRSNGSAIHCYYLRAAVRID